MKQLIKGLTASLLLTVAITATDPAFANDAARLIGGAAQLWHQMDQRQYNQRLQEMEIRARARQNAIRANPALIHRGRNPYIDAAPRYQLQQPTLQYPSYQGGY